MLNNILAIGIMFVFMIFALAVMIHAVLVEKEKAEAARKQLEDIEKLSKLTANYSIKKEEIKANEEKLKNSVNPLSDIIAANNSRVLKR